MKGYQKFLIIGTILLVAGIAIAGASIFGVAKEVLRNSVPVDSTLDAGKSQAFILPNLPAGQQVLMSLSGGGINKPFEASVAGPNGNKVASFNVTSTPFVGQATTKEEGNYTVTLANAGPGQVLVQGQLTVLSTGIQGGSAQGAKLQSVVAYGAGVAGGFAIVIAGITMLVIGLIKYFRDRNPSHQGYGR